MAEQPDIRITAQIELLKAKKDFAKSFAKVGSHAATLSKKLKAVNSAQSKLDNLLGKRQFSGWAMSLMFAGMAMKRTFDTIWASSSKVFNDVAHSVEGTVTGFDLLSGSLTYLQYTLGAALEPVATFLAPIIMRIADWVSENEKLVGTLLVTMGVVGTILMFLGGFKLALDGLIVAWQLLVPVITVAGQTIIGAVAAIGAPLWLVIGIILLVVAAIATNFGKIRDILVNVFKEIWTFLKNAFSSVGQILSGLWDVISGLLTGDIDKLLQGLTKMAFGVVKLLASALDLIVGVIINVIAFAWNAVVTGMSNQILLIMGLVKKAIELFNKVPGVNISTSGISQAIADAKKLKENLMVTPQRKGSMYDAISAVEQKVTNISTVNVNVSEKTDWKQLLNQINKSTQ